jgi:MoxR-like ATPase
MTKTGWLLTKDDFHKVDVLEEGDNHRKVAIAEGEMKGAELALPGESVPHDDCFPALFVQESRPEGFRFSCHAGTRFLQRVELASFANQKQAQALIPDPEPYTFRPVTMQVIDGIVGGDHNLIIGPKGCGKTSMILQLAARIGQPVVRLNFSGQISISDLVGSTGFGKREDGTTGTIWNDGPLPTAMKNGYWLLCDEFDFGAPDILSVFYPVLEEMDPKKGLWPKLTLKEKDGEVIKAHPRFRVFATGNSIGGDKDGRYVGTSPMNAALLDRFAGHGQVLKLEKIDAKAEKEILRMKVPNLPETQVKRATNFASDMRAGPIPDFSTRVLVNFCEKLLLYRNATTASRLTFLSVIDDENTRKEVEGKVKERFGVRVIIGRAAPAMPGAAGSVGESSEPEGPEGEGKEGEGWVPSEAGRVAKEVSEAEMKAIYEEKKAGKSYEAIEKDPKWNLRRAKGMTAWRIVGDYKKAAGIVEAPAEPRKKREPKPHPVETSTLDEAAGVEEALAAEYKAETGDGGADAEEEEEKEEEEEEAAGE